MGRTRKRPSFVRRPSASSVARYVRGRDYVGSGHSAPSGTRYVRFDCGDETGWVRFDEFVAGGTKPFVLMGRNGLSVVGIEDQQALRDLVAELRAFPPAAIVERPGWNGAYFALADGTCFAPDGLEAPIVLFEPASTKNAKAGDARWKKKLARLIVGQRLPSFALMAAFAGPLLDIVGHIENFGFEFVGKGGTGKTTIQRIAASVLGRAHRSTKGEYMMTGAATVNGLEAAMSMHSDAIIIIDDASRFAGNKTGKARGAEYIDLVQRLASGYTKARHGSPMQEGNRFVWLLSANEPLAEVVAGGREAVNAAAADRLLTIPIAASRSYGAFDKLPKRFKSSRQLAKALEKGFERHHGVAFPRFIERLVQSRHDDLEGLRSEVEATLAKFRAALGIDEDNGSACRVADAFGLVYAAGSLAKRYGVLPSKFKCRAAAKFAYRTHIESQDRPSFRERLIELSTKLGVIDLDKGKLPKLTDAKFGKVPAFLKTSRSGELEIRMSKRALNRAFPDWDMIKDSEEVASVRKREGRRGKVKRWVRQRATKDRVFCFVIDEEGASVDGLGSL